VRYEAFAATICQARTHLCGTHNDADSLRRHKARLSMRMQQHQQLDLSASRP